MLMAAQQEINIPKEVAEVMHQLTEAGFEAYAVGGCIRDLLLKREPKDWDVTTNAKPEEIQGLFPDAFYENQFGTVGVKTESDDPALKVVEVTTYRTEGKYTDRRHPDSVQFAEKLEDDLARRDFTVNAIAFGAKRQATSDKAQEYEIVDPYGGQEDLKAKVIRTVGEPAVRFGEDALRLIRAVRFAADLEFTIEDGTSKALEANADLLAEITPERIGEELKKLLMTDRADYGIELLREYRLMRHVLPELEEGWGMGQNKHHIYTVWEHNVRSLKYAAEKGYSLEVRMASLLHDVGKSRTKQGEGPNSTFYGHEVVGAKMAKIMLRRLGYGNDFTDYVTTLIRAHMFNYDPEVVTDASVRRLVAKVGAEKMRDLVAVREADRIGSGVPKAVPYRLRHFMYRVEKVLPEPTSRKQMRVAGDELIKELGFEPGPRMGAILDAMFEEIIDDPEKNDRKTLLKRAKELNALSDEDLSLLRRAAKEKYEAVLAEEDDEIKSKYRVQ